MAAKKKKQTQTKKKTQSAPQPNDQTDAFSKLPPEVQERLKTVKSKLDKFQKKVLDKFDKYIMGIALAPPKQPPKLGPLSPPNQGPAQQQAQGQLNPPAKSAPGTKVDKKAAVDPNEKDKINIIVLVDDSDSQKMSKLELKDKLSKIITTMAADIDKNIVTQTVIISELWQSCYDAKYDVLKLIALSAPIYDKGMMQAIKISEIHKSMVLKKFEKYIVSYVLAGSLTQGRATPTSDIDVWVVIDDTDVKKMTRVELKDKLRAIIIGMGIEAGEITRVKNKLNIQVYILTEFWDSLKEANPVIFTLLRDGVPFYDRGIFMPWKQLLKMGKIKPSPEAIDIFLGSGEQMIKRARKKIDEIGMEDTYYALLSPSQAALMLYGIPPPTPKETPEMMRELLVKKEKLLEEKFVAILEKNIQVRKEIEHGSKKELSGKELDELLTNADKYLKRIKRLFGQIQRIRDQKDITNVYDSVSGMLRDILHLEGVEGVIDTDLLKVTKETLVRKGKMPTKVFNNLSVVIKTKEQHEAGKLANFDTSGFQKDSQSIIRYLVEYIQRKRGRELERAKIRVKHGEKYGEVLLLDSHAYIIIDVDAKEKEIQKAKLTKEGGLDKVESATLEELEKAVMDVKIPKRAFIKDKIFADLKKVFGPEVEVLINY